MAFMRRRVRRAENAPRLLQEVIPSAGRLKKKKQKHKSWGDLHTAATGSWLAKMRFWLLSPMCCLAGLADGAGLVGLADRIDRPAGQEYIMHSGPEPATHTHAQPSGPRMRGS